MEYKDALTKVRSYAQSLTMEQKASCEYPDVWEISEVLAIIYEIPKEQIVKHLMLVL